MSSQPPAPQRSSFASLMMLFLSIYLIIMLFMVMKRPPTQPQKTPSGGPPASAWAEQGPVAMDPGAASGQPIAEPPFSVAGVWDSRPWGKMTLRQTGAHVTGDYEVGPGQIVGDFRGERLYFRWWEGSEEDAGPERAATNSRGDGYFVFLEGGKSFRGQWRYEGEGSWHSTWVGQTANGKSAPGPEKTTSPK